MLERVVVDVEAGRVDLHAEEGDCADADADQGEGRRRRRVEGERVGDGRCRVDCVRRQRTSTLGDNSQWRRGVPRNPSESPRAAVTLGAESSCTVYRSWRWAFQPEIDAPRYARRSVSVWGAGVSSSYQCGKLNARLTGIRDGAGGGKDGEEGGKD